MPAAVAIPAIASAVGAGVGFLGQRSAASQQAASNQAALDFQRQQEQERQREYQQQQEWAKYQWEAQQAQLAPYRAARASVLKRYGINTDVSLPQMPSLSGPPPAGSPLHKVPPQGNSVSPWLGLGTAATAGLASYRQGAPEVAGPPTGMVQQGTELSPSMAPMPQIAPADPLSGWNDWAQYGLPSGMGGR